MKNFKKLALATMALVLGFMSASSFARPDCDDMKALCDEGQINWCVMWQNDPSCH